MNRLLLLGCSQQKRADPGHLPAVLRYNGPTYKVLRRYAAANPDDVPDVYILSAQYGLIHGDTPILAYDRRLTVQRAQELREHVASELRDLDQRQQYQHIFMCAGANYRRVLLSAELDMAARQRLMLAVGSIGTQLTLLKSWLYQLPESPPELELHVRNTTAPVRFKLRGIEYEVTPSTVAAVVDEAVGNGAPEAFRAGGWYVPIHGRKLAPKWLVSQLTGMPVGRFHSEEARRVLAQIGLSARQI